MSPIKGSATQAPVGTVFTGAEGSTRASAGGLRGYVNEYTAKTRQFSRNANLYVIHVIGMDMIHGSFNVLFNLYLLAIGFDIAFIGLRLMIGFVARAATALPVGLVSDPSGASRRSSWATEWAQ